MAGRTLNRLLRRADSQVSVGLAFALMLGTPASAQTAFTNRSDVLGIQLGDGIDAVKKKIATQFPGSSALDVKDTIRTPEHTEELTIGTIFDVTGAGDKSTNADKAAQDKLEAAARVKAGLSSGTPFEQKVGSVGDRGREMVAVTWYSGAGGGSNVFGIGRAKEFLAAERPLLANTVAALVAKYGKPLQENRLDQRNRHKYLFWASSPNLDRRKCLKEQSTPYLYEDAGFGGISRPDQTAQTLRILFLGQVNNLHARNPVSDLSMCGTVLRAHMLVTDDDQYVTQLNIDLVDMTGGQNALRTLGDNFFAEVDRVKGDKLRAAGQKTPKM